MAVSREVREGDQWQGIDEKVPYGIDTSNWGGLHATPNIVVVVKDEADHSDVTATVMPTGDIVVEGNVVTLKPLQALTQGHWYRIEVKFVNANGAILECYFRVEARE